MLLMPLNSAMARNARRQASSAATSSELAGGCRNGRGSWIIEWRLSPYRPFYHDPGRQGDSAKPDHRGVVYAANGRFPLQDQRKRRDARGRLHAARPRSSRSRMGKRPLRACAQVRTIVPSNVSLLKKSGSRIERQPHAESLLARRALGPPQPLGNLPGSGFLFCQRPQLANFGGCPRAPFLCSISHKSSLSIQANGVP